MYTFLLIFRRQLDSRLAKVPPVKATISATPPKESGDFTESDIKHTIVKNVNAGKAKAFDKVEFKVLNDLQIKVSTSAAWKVSCNADFGFSMRI